jgi:Domain of unknown function (DUF4405)
MSISRSHTIVIKLLVDASMTAAVLMLLTLALTGLAVHEWLGIALLVIAMLHLLLNWAWIVTGVRRFFGPLSPLVRFNAILNSLLFMLMSVVLGSGLMISVVALRFFGLRMLPSIFLRLVHQVSADALLLVVGLHLGMNWRSVVTSLRKLLAAPVARGLGHVAAFLSARRFPEHRA